MIEQTSDLWWKNALFYCADVKTFVDADGDGVGDLKGLTAGLDHRRDHGVGCRWLMPVHPPPRRDDGALALARHRARRPR